MDGLTHPFVTLGLLSTAAALGIGAFAWTQRQTRGAVTYAGLMVVLGVWSALYVGQLLQPTIGAKRPWFLARHALVPLISVLFWLFAASYTDRWALRSRRYVGPIYLVGGLLALVVIWNPADLYWTGMVLRSEGTLELLVLSFGPLFWVNILFMAAVVGGGHLVIVGMLKGAFTAYRPQLLVMAVVGVIEFSLALAFLSDHLAILPSLNPWPHLQLTTYGATLVAVPLGWSYFNEALFDIQPVARRAVVADMEDAVFFIDTTGVVRFTNPQANRLVGRDEDESVESESVEAVFRSQPTLLESYREALSDGSGPPDETVTPVARTIDGERRYFDIRVSTITNSVGERTGVVMVARNVTEARRRRDELRARTVELERRTEQLEERNERLDNFGSFVAHDLRNPIQIASGYVEIARETGDEAYLEKAGSAIERMDDMITDLYDLTRVDESALDEASVRVGRVFRGAWDTVDTEGATYEIDGDLTVRADETYLRHVFENLVSNSITHGGPDDGATLVITVGALDDGFYIEDDGVGIPKAERDSVLDHGYTTASGGTGLGMAIVQTVAEAHGWTISVTDSEAGGARFEFTNVERADEEAGSPTQ